MKYMVDNVLPMVTDQLDIKRRQGAIECIYRILSSNLWLISDLVTTLDTEILPYVIFLIVPVMGRMSDSDNDVRLLATETFATLVKLVPLEAGIPDPPGMSEEMLAERDEERKFIAQMLDGSKVEPFKIPVAIQADLRKYQQDGVNWLAFLNKYHLHGVLCDGTNPSILLPNSRHGSRQDVADYLYCCKRPLPPSRKIQGHSAPGRPTPSHTCCLSSNNHWPLATRNIQLRPFPQSFSLCRQSHRTSKTPASDGLARHRHHVLRHLPQRHCHHLPAEFQLLRSGRGAYHQECQGQGHDGV
jgi:hypothetical protein